MPSGLLEPGLVTVGGEILALGGTDPVSGNPTSRVLELDEAAGIWREMAPLAQPLDNFKWGVVVFNEE